MELEVLRKKISSYRTEGGTIKNLSDDILLEILTAWEQWTGPASGFHKAIDVNQKRMGSLIGQAKKLKREGRFPVEEFKEIKIQESTSNLASLYAGPCAGVELIWDGNKLIRFQQVEQLVDFLKKVA